MLCCMRDCRLHDPLVHIGPTCRAGCIDHEGSLYMWGKNKVGELGLEGMTLFGQVLLCVCVCACVCGEGEGDGEWRLSRQSGRLASWTLTSSTRRAYVKNVGVHTLTYVKIDVCQD